MNLAFGFPDIARVFFGYTPRADMQFSFTEVMSLLPALRPSLPAMCRKRAFGQGNPHGPLRGP